MNKYNIIVNGKKYEAKNNLEIISPESNLPIGYVTSLEKEEIEQIFLNAKEAFEGWKKINYKKRIDYIISFANILLKNKKTLALKMVDEIAKSYNESIKEIERSYEYILETIKIYKKYFSNPKKLKEDKPNGISGELMREPLGVVTCISPFNYPINLAISKIIPAIILGNCVVFKPATNGSISGCLISEYFYKAKLPKNVFNIITGKGSLIGDLIITNPNANMISFTGGVEIGKRILENNKKIPIVLELGGKDPAIVLEDANIKFTAKKIVKGSLSFSGQRCTAIKIVYCHNKIIKKLIEEIVKEVNELSIGNAIDNKDITSLINSNALNWAKELIDDAKQKGANIILGGQNKNNLLYPTIITNINDEMKIFDEEQFAPIIPIKSFNSIDEVISYTKKSQYGLQASIFTKDKKIFKKIANSIEYSTINFNKEPSRSPDIFPFTGNKNSGFGVQGIYWSLESMSKIKLLK